MPCILNNKEGYIDVNVVKTKESNDKKSLVIKLSKQELLSFHDNNNKYINHYNVSDIVEGYKDFKMQEKNQDLQLEKEAV